MARSVDLDAARAARAETLGETPSVIFGGKTFDLPVEFPFAVVEGVRQMLAAQKNEDGFAVSASIGEMMEVLFGDRYEEFLQLNPSMADMQELLEHVAGLYGLNSGESQASEN